MTEELKEKLNKLDEILTEDFLLSLSVEELGKIMETIRILQNSLPNE